MTVRWAGDCRLLEQLGDKQDFECALTALDLPPEDFALKAVRMTNRELGPQWSQDYRVTVTCLAGGFRHVYIGGPRHRSVARCAEDLAPARARSRCGGPPMRRRVITSRSATEAASGEQRFAE